MKTKKSVAKSVASTAKPVAVKTEESATPVVAAPKPLKKAAPAAARKPAAKNVSPAKTEVAKAVKAVKAPKAEKSPKLKVVRDSFTMPQDEYQKISELKALCLNDGLQVKKSEVLRAGLKVFSEMSLEQMKGVLQGLEKIKTGRPNKH